MVADTNFKSNTDIFEQWIKQHPLLSGKGQIPKEAAKKRKSHNRSGIFFLALILFFAFATVRIVFERHVQNLIKVFTSFRISKRQLNDQLENDNRASLVLGICYFMSTGYILYTLMKYWAPEVNHLSSWYAMIICMFITGGLFLLKYLLIELLAWVFKGKEAARQYVFDTRVIQEFTTLFLFPTSILLFVSEGKLNTSLLYFVVVFLILMMLYRYIRISGGLKKLLRIDLFHFLMYLCAFEIIPICILLKIVM